MYRVFQKLNTCLTHNYWVKSGDNKAKKCAFFGHPVGFLLDFTLSVVVSVTRTMVETLVIVSIAVNHLMIDGVKPSW